MSPVSKAVFVAVVLGPVGVAAVAQQAPSAAANGADVPQVEEVVVTAQKVEQRLLDVPQSVSVVSADELADIHAERLDDFFTRVPSAAVDETQGGLARLILRGLNTGGVGSTVGTYVDETPVGSATEQVNGAILTPDLDPSDIERVEILRGPQGTLYGASTLGGLVKYVTTPPSTDGVHGSAEVSGEDVHDGSVGWSGHGAINVPLTDTLAVRASGFYRHDPGYIDDPHFGKDINDGRTYGGRLSALFTPTDQLTVRATATVENLYSDGTNAVEVDPVTLRPTLGALTQSHVVEQPNDMQYRIYNLTATYDFGPVRLLSSTSLSRIQETAILDDSGVYTEALAPELGVIGYSQTQDIGVHTATEELRLTNATGGFADWTVGGFFNHESSLLAQVVNGVDYGTGDPLDGLGGLFAGRIDARYREFAGFANATLHLAKMWDLTFGGRYSHNNQLVTQTTSGPLIGDSLLGATSADNVFTYSVAPAFKPNDNTTLYARVAKGYRPGGPNLLPPGAPPGVPLQSNADTTVNYEVGIKTELLDRRLSLELTAFDIDWRHIQLLAVVENVGVEDNGGSARSDGLEFSVTGRPLPGLTLSADGAYIDARLTEDAPAIVGGVKGNYLPYTARFTSTVSADYERVLVGSTKGTAGLSWRFTGARESAFDTTYGQRQLPSYGQIDGHVGVLLGNVRVDAFVRNLTDSRGILDVGAAGSELNDDVAAAVTRPRSFGLSLGYKF